MVGLYLLSCLQESFVTDCGRVVAGLRERYILRCRSRKGRIFLLNLITVGREPLKTILFLVGSFLCWRIYEDLLIFVNMKLRV